MLHTLFWAFAVPVGSGLPHRAFSDEFQYVIASSTLCTLTRPIRCRGCNGTIFGGVWDWQPVSWRVLVKFEVLLGVLFGGSIQYNFLAPWFLLPSNLGFIKEFIVCMGYSSHDPVVLGVLLEPLLLRMVGGSWILYSFENAVVLRCISTWSDTGWRVLTFEFVDQLISISHGVIRFIGKSGLNLVLAG